MKHLMIAVVFSVISGALSLGCAKAPNTTTDLATVASLDLKRWEGAWYELARIPVPIGRDWVNTVETYIPREDGTYSVVYVGHAGSPDGPAKSLKQRLKIPDPSRPGEMRVSFLPLVWLDYRLIYMEENYRFMLVTGSTRDYLWLMGREKVPSVDDYAKLLERAAAMGFDVSRLERVRQE